MRASIPTRQLRSRPEPLGPLQRQPRLTRGAGALQSDPLDPNASSAWSLAAVPNPRSPERRLAGRPRSP
jgi:hypothetical protein